MSVQTLAPCTAKSTAAAAALVPGRDLFDDPVARACLTVTRAGGAVDCTFGCSRPGRADVRQTSGAHGFCGLATGFTAGLMAVHCRKRRGTAHGGATWQAAARDDGGGGGGPSEAANDLLSGQRFSQKALFLFEGERPLVPPLLAVTGILSVAGISGLLTTGIGKVANLPTPGNSQGLDSEQGLLVLALAAFLGTAGFWSLLNGRTSALKKIDSELAFGPLQYDMADGIRLRKRVKDEKSKRKLILFGKGEALASALRRAAGYRRRWVTSDTVVVATDALPSGVAGTWVAEACDPELWEQCCDELRRNEVIAPSQPGEAAGWVLLGKTGRVRGSGDAGNFDEVLAFLGVTANLSELPARAPGIASAPGEVATAAQEILAVHDDFYEALIEGNIGAMRPLWMNPEQAESEAMQKRRVPWESVLSEKAAVLAVVDVDVVFTQSGPSPTEALVTSIEVCKGEPSLLNEGGPGGKGTLLATKVFHVDPSSEGNWRLISHQTIPYCKNTIAFQSLRCTNNGCILLKRD